MRKKAFKVLLLEGIPSTASDFFERSDDFEVEIIKEELTEAQLAKKVEQVHLIGVGGRKNVLLTDEVIRSAHRLLAIGCFATHTRAVDVACATEMGIPVFSSPYGNSHSQAEYAMGQIILLARQLGDRTREMGVGNWQKVSSNCFEIRGKTLGIIGYGHVGAQLGIMAEFFGMRVVWFDHLPLMPMGNSTSLDTMNDVLKEADFLSVNISSKEENENLIKKEQLAMMKPGSFIINCSFGKAIHLDDLTEALKSRHILGASIDCFPFDEVPDFSLLETLRGCSNVVLTPKLAGRTMESTRRIGLEVAIHIDSYLREGSTQGAINFPLLKPPPLQPNINRILNIHRNVRGVVKEINSLLSDVHITSQTLETNELLGYAIIDLDKREDSTELITSLAALANSIRTRFL